MTVEPRGPEVAAPEPAHHALLSLHALAGDVDPRAVPEPLGLVDAMNVVAAASHEEIPTSARLSVLYTLARAGHLEDADARASAHTLAESMRGDRDWLAVPDLVEDVRTAAARNEPLSATPNGRRLEHHETAFIGEALCTTKRVTVGGLDAISIFSEFETDADFDHVASWIDPRTWSNWGPLFFKEMRPVESPSDLVDLSRPPGDEHWNGVFREEVRLPLRRITTYLTCAYWKDSDRAAGMTYDLAMSLDGQLDVDQGYLLVNTAGGVNRVKVLKVVGFTNNLYDELALWVCPWWTDWVRHAVRGGTSSQPHVPAGSQAQGATAPSCVDAFDAWMDLVGESAHSYFDIVEDAASRARSSGYTTTDLMEHGRSYWSQLAKDWATAWTYGLETLGSVAQDGLDADLRPPSARRQARAGATPPEATVTGNGSTDGGPTAGGTSSSTAGATASGTTGASTPADTAGAGAALAVEPETVIIPIEDLGPNDRPVVSDLVSIGAGGVTIPAARVVVTVVDLGGGAYGVRLGTTATVPHGLYVGHVTGAGSQRRLSVQLYVDRATRT